MTAFFIAAVTRDGMEDCMKRDLLILGGWAILTIVGLYVWAYISGSWTP